jgi:hypothetical protein
VLSTSTVPLPQVTECYPDPLSCGRIILYLDSNMFVRFIAVGAGIGMILLVLLLKGLPVLILIRMLPLLALLLLGFAVIIAGVMPDKN